MKRHTTLADVSTVARSLGLAPTRFIRADATDDELVDASEESEMAEHLNRIEDAFEQSQPREMTAEEMAAVYRAQRGSTPATSLGELGDEVRTTHGISLREASVAARQAGNMDGAAGNIPGVGDWVSGKAPGAGSASMGPAAETQTVTCPNCRYEFSVAAVHKTKEAAVMGAGDLTSMLDSLLESECDLYGLLAGKKIISADDKREAVAAVAKMLGEHIGHLDQVQTKYSGGKDDAEIRQSAALTDYLEERGYVGMGRPLREYAGRD